MRYELPNVSKISDIFQKLVALPNAPKDQQFKSIAWILNELEQLDVRPKGQRIGLIKRGRNEYLHLLASRGRHLLNRADRFASPYKNRMTVPFTGKYGERLRDFYHNCYYAAFYATRYGMVANGAYDCTNHRELPEVLTLLNKSNNGLKTSTDFTSAKLRGLNETRSFSDYVMNTNQLSRYATPAAVLGATSDAKSLFDLWSVP